MKPLLPLLMCLFLFSCGQGNNNTKQTTHTDSTHITAPKTDSTTYNTRLDNYQKFVSELDTSDANSATTAANKFKELFNTPDTVLNDRAYMIFERFYAKLMFGINDHLFKDDKTPINYETFKVEDENTYPAALRDLNTKLKANGYRFIEVEGSPVVSQDRIILIKWFYPSVSITMRKYLDEVNKENAEGLEDDGGLTIPVTLLSDRTVWWEQFSTEHPRFVFAHEAQFQKQIYFTYLLTGMDNTPMIDYETKTISKDFKDAYDHLLTTYPNSETAKLVKPYYDALLAKKTAEAKQIVEKYRSQKLMAF
jgi:hypothetical protein